VFHLLTIAHCVPHLSPISSGQKKEKLTNNNNNNNNNNLNALNNYAKGWMSRVRTLVGGKRLVSQISKPPLESTYLPTQWVTGFLIGSILAGE